MTFQYRLMKMTDCEEVTHLLQRNAQSQGGGLLGEFPLSKVESMFANSLRVIIAYERNHIVGVVFSFDVKSSALPPLAQYITQQFKTEINNSWFYGPVCIDAAYRGKNMLKPLYDAICAQQTGSPVAFINIDNIRSLKAHQKLGMREIAEFSFAGTRYYLVKG